MNKKKTWSMAVLLAAAMMAPAGIVSAQQGPGGGGPGGFQGPGPGGGGLADLAEDSSKADAGAGLAGKMQAAQAADSSGKGPAAVLKAGQ